MKIIKFGGTSLQTQQARERAVSQIYSLCEKDRVVVVVSAMGRFPDPYATDTLLSLAEELDPWQRDLLMSAGEMVSTMVMTSLCRKRGIRCDAVSALQLGIFTDDQFNDAHVLAVTPEILLDRLKRSRCVVVPGFQGVTVRAEVTTLGRGGSDYTAILLAKALGVGEVVLVTDVDGIYDHDPKTDPHARRYAWITPEQMLKLIDQGARVLMRRCVEEAQENGIRIWVGKSIYDCGTWVETGS